MDRRSLAVCAIFRDEAPHLLEWIAYHRVIGFDRFVLYDNGSTDGGADLIRASNLADRVTVVHWPQRPGQLSAYRHFIDIFAPAYDWAAFIDVDEFVLPLGGVTLHETLQRCSHASAVLVNWRVFGPAGHEEPPPGLVIEAYDLRADDALPVNRHVKSIARCADLLDVTQNPYEFRLKGPVSNPLGLEVANSAIQPNPCHQALVVNRYYTKSRREWAIKLHRGDAASDTAGPAYTEDVFDHLAAVCQVKDAAIQEYVPQVRELLANIRAAGGPVPSEPTRPLSPPSQEASKPAELATAPSPQETAGQGPMMSETPATPDLVWSPDSQSLPASGWRAIGVDAQQRLDGLAFVFRDRSRTGATWLAALRGGAAGPIDPDFLLDEAGRLRDFPTEQEARAACEAELAEDQLD